METKIWYSVRNGGDGSAYPVFMEHKRMAELDQQYMDEGWGELCYGYIAVEHDGPIKAMDIVTLEEMIKDTQDDLDCSYISTGRKEGMFELIIELKKLRDTNG